MKKLNLNLVFVSLAILGFCFIASSCSTNESDKAPKSENQEKKMTQGESAHMHDAEDRHEEDAINISDDEAEMIVNAYLKIKEALVGSDATVAAASAKEMLEETKDIDGGAGFKDIRSRVEEIANSSDIKKQRKAFADLSAPISNLAEHHNMGMTLYKQYCPMALNNEGAYWLSKKEEIFNPYFGDKMMHCGSVKAVIAGKK